MSSLFIIGNGFDIAHDIHTSYGDFRKYIIRRFPNALKVVNQTRYIDDYKKVDIEEFAAEILLNTMDRVGGPDWNNFEEALAYISFDNKLPKPKHKINETVEEDNDLMQKYLLYIDQLMNGFIYCTKYWQYFFQAWIKEVDVTINRNTYKCKKSLETLFCEPDIMFFSFNYTMTLEKLYGIKKVTHIHNQVGKKLIFGHGQDNVPYNDIQDGLGIASSFMDDMIMEFKKDTSIPIRKYKGFFKKLNSDIDKVYSYGFSYGKVDAVYIKRIIRNISPNAEWYFTAFEARDAEALRIKKVKLRNYGFKGKFAIYEG